MNIAIAPVHTRNTCDVAIVGAGPYGLAAAAHLRAAGVETRIFGEPLSFWRSNMPHGMKLRSPWVATHFAHPHDGFSLDDYYREAGLEVPKLLPLTNFVDYGLWFQHRIAPDLDRRKITRIDAIETGFRLALSDGDVVFARRVVMAAGLLGHEYRPPEFDNLPRALVSHSSEHTDSTRYRGQRVAVIGRGQSATESAALLHETGVEVEIFSRGHLEWNADPQTRGSFRRGVRAMLGDRLIPPSQVGPFPYNWLNEAPGVIHRLPQRTRDALNERSLRPTAITWLRDRLKHVPVHGGQRILGAQTDGEGIALALEGATRRFDHVLLATGYRIDVGKMAMLAPQLRARIARHGGLPRLSAQFESSVPGLHFIGASAVASFGPLLRFIAGAGFAARRLARVAGRGRKVPAEAIASFDVQELPLAAGGRD